MNWQKSPIQTVSLKDKSYPKILTKITKPPRKLFYRGFLKNELFKKSLAIVGSRRMTRYGQEVLERFVPELASGGVTIISGFMYGVDTQAHKLAVEAGGRTVAVFGSGVNICYPPENNDLYTKILEKGGVLSEYKPDQKAQLWMFSRRNRIVAGLASLGVLIIEAAEGSGSLITARFAQEQKKLVFAVPGPITSTASAGTNLLIKEGFAKMVTQPSDIVLVSKPSASGARRKLPPLEQKIYDFLSREPATADEIAAALDENIVALTQTLSLMSLKGVVTEVAGKFYFNP